MAAKRSYHTVVVFGEKVSPGEIQELLERFRRFLEERGGENIETVPLGRKRLAYRIKKNYFGEYYILRFDLSPERVNEFNEHLRYTPPVIRFATFLGREEPGENAFHHLNYEQLKNYITERGKIRNRRQNRLPAKKQRQLARMIKRARILGFLPFTTLRT